MALHIPPVKNGLPELDEMMCLPQRDVVDNWNHNCLRNLIIHQGQIYHIKEDNDITKYHGTINHYNW